MITVCLNILSVSFEILIYYFFFRYFFGRIRFHRLGMIGIYVLAIALSLFLTFTQQPGCVKWIGYFMVIFIISAGYYGQLYIKLFVPFLFQAISIMVERSYVFILAPLYLDVQIHGEIGLNFYYFSGIILSNLTILLLVRLLAGAKDYFFMRNQSIDVPQYYAAVFIFPMSMLFVIEQYTLMVVKAGAVTVASVFPVLVIISVTVIFFFLFDELLRNIQHRQQIELLNRQLEQEQRYHNILLEKHQKFQQLRHDMKHSMNSIAGLIKNGYSDKALEYAQNQSGQLAAISVIETGHPLLDTVFTIQEDHAQRLGAEFQSYVTADLADIKILAEDIASICANLLSNAVEAVTHIADPAQRKIWCSITQDKQYLYIQVHNTTASPVMITDEIIETTKPDKTAHGFGLQIVKNITQKYNGTCMFQYENYIFTVKMILPVEGVENNDISNG